MSRIGKREIIIPQDVKVDIGNEVVISKGNYRLTQVIPSQISVKRQDNKLIVKTIKKDKISNALYGLTQKLLSNMIKGLQDPFKKILTLKGIGFKAQVTGKELVLNVGYSHPVNFKIPNDINITVDGKSNQIVIAGVNKEKVGEIAADIRRVRLPEPYKGTGIMYIDEKVRKKVGKAGAGAGAAKK